MISIVLVILMNEVFLMTMIKATASYRRELGDGLVERWSTSEDTEKIARLMGEAFKMTADSPPDEWTMKQVYRHMSGDYPYLSAGDYAVVEDTQKEGHPIVAGVSLWRYTMTYDGIPFKVGQPEFVAVDAAYRKRGLIRSLFEMIHERSAEEGHHVQVINGIYHFYRQFGYEYALDMGGRRITFLSQIPGQKVGEVEPLTVRDAQAEDIPHLLDLYNSRSQMGLVRKVIPESDWRFFFEEGQNYATSGQVKKFLVIESTEHEFLGYAQVVANVRWDSAMQIRGMEFVPAVNLQSVILPLLRSLRAYGAKIPPKKQETAPFSQINFSLGRSHPVYDVLGKELAPLYEPPYAWYVRVPDLRAFLQLITPVLERRLAESIIVDYTGELKLFFYRYGLRLVFDHGRLFTIEPWEKPFVNDEADANFPALVFLQLLFGHRSLDDLRYAFPDVTANREAETLLNVLFPLKPSWIIALD
jgi:predicted N-acetyltransferase YhbS